MRRTCRGCDRVLGVSGDGFCVRCEHVRPVQWIIADLDRRGYPHTGRLRRFVRHYGELVDQQRDVEHERRCEHCHGPLPARRSGPPATYCSARCRKAAWRERVRDGSAA